MYYQRSRYFRRRGCLSPIRDGYGECRNSVRGDIAVELDGTRLPEAGALELERSYFSVVRKRGRLGALDGIRTGHNRCKGIVFSKYNLEFN